MSFLRHLKLGHKLIIAFGALVGVNIVVGFAAIHGMADMATKADEMHRHAVLGLSALGKTTTRMKHMRLSQYRHMLAKDDAGKAKNEKTAATAAGEASEHLQEFKSTIPEGETKAKEQCDKLISLWTQYKEGSARFVVASNARDTKTADQILSKELLAVAQNINKLADEIADTSDKRAKLMAKAVDDAARQNRNIVGLAMLFGVIATVVFSSAISGTIVRPAARIRDRLESLESQCLDRMEQGMRLFAQGDLTFAIESNSLQLEITSNDEFGQIAEAINRAVQKVDQTIGSYNSARLALSGMVGELIDSSSKVAETSRSLSTSASESAAASSEIAHASERLAHETTDTAARIQEVSKSVEEVGQATERQTTLLSQSEGEMKAASEAISGVTCSARDMASVAREGDAGVQGSIASMEQVRGKVQEAGQQVRELDEKGKQIGNIVAAIQQIAEQTNLLALNAAIEAARAGEHGRGFAVVADEVRKLAEQASGSASEIANLISGVSTAVSHTVQSIEATQSEVDSGVNRSLAAGEVLRRIVAAAEHVAEDTETVAVQAQSIATNLAKVTHEAERNSHLVVSMAKNVDEFEGSVQSVAAASQEASAGAEELTASAHEVHHATSALHEMANDLRSIAGRFRSASDHSSPPQRKAA